MNQVINEQKTSSKNATLSVRNELMKALFTPTESGINVNGIEIPENVTGENIKAAKKQSIIVIEKKQAAQNRLDAIESLSQILKDVKLYGGNYLKAVELQYEVKITGDMLTSVIPSMFIPMQTEKERENQAKHPNRWKFSKVLTLIARYYKTRLLTEKLAVRTEKALSKLEVAI